MSDPRRRATVAQLTTLGLRCWIYSGHGDAEGVRQTCLRLLVADLLEESCQRLVLESRGRADDRRDVHTITTALGPKPSKSGLVYEHFAPYEEPLLWIADVAAWCQGANADYRRRIAPIVGRNTNVGTAIDKLPRRR